MATKKLTKFTIKAYALAAALAIGLSGCTDYKPQMIEEGTVIPAMSLINVELEKEVHLIPNQQVEVKLSVPEMNGKKVSGVFVKGIANVNTEISRANILIDTMIFESDQGVEQRSVKAFAIDADDIAGIHVKCNNSDEKVCGYYIMERDKVYWKLAPQQPIDIGGITVMMEES